MGKARILQELKQKGIDRETAQAALEELDQEEKDEAADSGFSDDEFGELLDLLNKNKR